MVIYKATNKDNGKIYIGATVSPLKKRESQHIYDRRRNNTLISRAIFKYGRDNFKFQIIEIEPNIETMHEREQYYIVYYNSMDNGYNRTTGGINCKASEKFLKKMKDARSGDHARFYGKSHSKESIQKMRLAQQKRREKEFYKKKKRIENVKVN